MNPDLPNLHTKRTEFSEEEYEKHLLTLFAIDEEDKQNRKKLPSVEAPSEFDLSRYAALDKWKAKEWAAAFRHRLELKTYWLEECKPYNRQISPERFDAVKKKALENILSPLSFSSYPEEPQPPLIEDMTAMDLVLMQTRSPIDEVRDKYDAVASMNIQGQWGDIRIPSLRNKELNKLIQYFSQHSDSPNFKEIVDPLYTTPAWKLDEEMDEEQKFFINVNLGAPEDLLIKEFKKWLKETKRAAGVTRVVQAYGDTHFFDWTVSRILPYFDLAFWATANNVQIKLGSMREKLFENNSDSDDNIRKTIAKNTDELISAEVISALTFSFQITSLGKTN